MERVTSAKRLSQWWALWFVFSLAGLSIITACGTAVVPGTATPLAPATPTGVGLPTISPAVPMLATATLDLDSGVLTKIAVLQTRYPDAYATAYTEEVQRAQRMAQWLLTPQPSYIPVLPPGYLTPTPVLGIKECGVGSQSSPWPENCWRGYVNGQMVLVKAGIPPGDKAHGIVWIVADDQDENGVPWYAAPQVVPGLRILSVSGTRMLLEPIVPPPTPITFTFDLATHQWIGPDGTPLPSPSPSPAPSQSPLPSPSAGPSPLPSPTLGPSPLPTPSP